MNGLNNNLTFPGCNLNGIVDSFTEDDLKLLSANHSKMSFSAGETVIKQGGFVSQILYVQKGIVKKVLEAKNNRNIILKLVDDNKFVALPIIGNPNQYPFTIKAITNCDISFIKIESMLEIMKRNTAIDFFLLKWFSDDYLYIYEKILRIGTRNSHGRVATALLYLSNGQFKQDILNIISRKDLADLAAVSIESVNKILQQLRHDGLITINKHHQITIKRKDLIEKLSDSG